MVWLELLLVAARKLAELVAVQVAVVVEVEAAAAWVVAAQVVVPQHAVVPAVEVHRILHKESPPRSLHGAPSSLPVRCHP